MGNVWALPPTATYSCPNPQGITCFCSRSSITDSTMPRVSSPPGFNDINFFTSYITWEGMLNIFPDHLYSVAIIWICDFQSFLSFRNGLINFQGENPREKCPCFIHNAPDYENQWNSSRLQVDKINDSITLFPYEAQMHSKILALCKQQTGPWAVQQGVIKIIIHSRIVVLTQGCLWVNLFWQEAAFATHTQGGADAALGLLAQEAACSAPAQQELSSIAKSGASISSPDF